MKKYAIAILLSGFTLLMADGAALYKKCVGCHGENGEKSFMNKTTPFTGRDAATTIKQIKGYKAGTLNQYGVGGYMKAQVSSMSDADIKAVADYIAAMK